MGLWRLTDNQYIARLRWLHQRRRVHGLVMGVICLTLLALAFHSAHQLTNKSLEMINAVAELRNPTDEQFAVQHDNTRFFIGFWVGASIGGLLLCLSLTFGTSLHMLFRRDRKVELLLDRDDRIQTDRSQRDQKETPKSE